LAEGDSSGYEEARHAIAEALDHVLRPHDGQKDGVTYSVHYSDVNGLSRLENYILGLEIATYLSEFDTTLTAVPRSNRQQEQQACPTAYPLQQSCNMETLREDSRYRPVQSPSKTWRLNLSPQTRLPMKPRKAVT
jgi:hypothetical protein